jgi:hypothetical protein
MPLTHVSGQVDILQYRDTGNAARLYSELQEGLAGGFSKEVVRVVEFAFVLAVGFEDLPLRGLQDLVDAPEDGQREDDVLVLAALEGVADQVGDGPEE